MPPHDRYIFRLLSARQHRARVLAEHTDDSRVHPRRIDGRPPRGHHRRRRARAARRARPRRRQRRRHSVVPRLADGASGERRAGTRRERRGGERRRRRRAAAAGREDRRADARPLARGYRRAHARRYREGAVPDEPRARRNARRFTEISNDPDDDAVPNRRSTPTGARPAPTSSGRRAATRRVALAIPTVITPAVTPGDASRSNPSRTPPNRLLTPSPARRHRIYDQSKSPKDLVHEDIIGWCAKRSVASVTPGRVTGGKTTPRRTGHNGSPVIASSDAHSRRRGHSRSARAHRQGRARRAVRRGVVRGRVPGAQAGGEWRRRGQIGRYVGG